MNMDRYINLTKEEADNLFCIFAESKIKLVQNNRNSIGLKNINNNRIKLIDKVIKDLKLK